MGWYKVNVSACQKALDTINRELEDTYKGSVHHARLLDRKEAQTQLLIGAMKAYIQRLEGELIDG